MFHVEQSDQIEADAAFQRQLVDLSACERSVVAERLAAYVSLIRQWSPKLNLVGPGEMDHFWERHIKPCLDLRAALLCVPHDVIVDVGSGAGLPGIPLALTVSRVSVVLVESRRKRANFLRHVVRSLSMPHVDVVCARVESWSSAQPADVVVSRAVTSPTQLCALSAHVSAPHGCYVVTRGPESAQVDPAPGVALTMTHSAPTPHRYQLFHRTV